MTVFASDLITYLDNEQLANKFLTNSDRLRLNIYPFIFSTFFNFILIYILRVNATSFIQQQLQNTTIVRQNNQLENTRKMLENANSSLEERVQTRTSELVEQNNKLTEYAFLHSHVLRAPVSRISGLLHLLNLDIEKEEESKVRGLLADTATELVQVTREMTDRLLKAQYSAPQM